MDNGSLFDAEICADSNIYFHGSHRSNLESIIKSGIAQPKYPTEVVQLIEKFKDVTTLLSLSHALKTYEYTYKGDQDIVFLTQNCIQAASYVRGVAGEKMTTLTISINNLKLLFDDGQKLNFEIEKCNNWIQKTYGEEREKIERKLYAFKNLQDYEPLLNEAVTIQEKYSEYFFGYDGKGIVCAVDGREVEFEDQRSDGYSVEYIPPEKILGIVSFNFENLPFECEKCRQKLRSYSSDSH